jgi:hypothetical protein
MDYTGALYSDSVEAATVLSTRRWGMVHLDGDLSFTGPLLYVEPGTSVEYPLDQTVLQPLSSADGEVQPPIVITGQWQGERMSLAIFMTPDDQRQVRLLQRAARTETGRIALKDPKGAVLVVQLGAMRAQHLEGGFLRLDVPATRVA